MSEVIFFDDVFCALSLRQFVDIKARRALKMVLSETVIDRGIEWWMT